MVVAAGVRRGGGGAGTPYYLSPEIWRNRPYNQQSDIWSLGVILYELIALRLPFEASTPDQLARKVIRGEFAPLPPQYSRELTGLISKMLGMLWERERVSE